MLMSRPDGTYIYWDYLKNALFDIHHTGELNNVRIDYPEPHPIDGSELGNQLFLNDQLVPNQTFLVFP